MAVAAVPSRDRAPESGTARPTRNVFNRRGRSAAPGYRVSVSAAHASPSIVPTPQQIAATACPKSSTSRHRPVPRSQSNAARRASTATDGAPRSGRREHTARRVNRIGGHTRIARKRRTAGRRPGHLGDRVVGRRSRGRTRRRRRARTPRAGRAASIAGGQRSNSRRRPGQAPGRAHRAARARAGTIAVGAVDADRVRLLLPTRLRTSRTPNDTGGRSR